MALSIAVTNWEVFLLVLVRVVAMVMVAPALGARPIPAQIKVCLSVLLALLLTPLQGTRAPLAPDWLAVALAVSREVVIGLLLGFAATLVFSSVRMAAHMVGVQIGFGFANTLDPLSTENASFLDSFYNLLAVVVFLNLGGHHALIAGLSGSLELMPVGDQDGPPSVVGDRLILLGSMALTTAASLAMPALGALLLTDAAMALVMRTIPQMNIFAVGLPIKMLVGIFALAAMAPMTVAGFGDVTRNVAGAANGLLR